MYRRSDSTMFNSAHICIAAYLLLRLVQAAVVQNPADVTVQPSEWAQFSCTVKNCSCVETVNWFIVRRDRAPIRSNSKTACTPGSDGRQTYFLKLFATEAMNNLALYCVAYESSDCGLPQCNSRSHYSRPALLMVEPAEEPVTTPTPSPSPSHSSSCTPLQKMVTPEVIVTSQVIVTSEVIVTSQVIVTPQVMLTPQAVTVTATQTQTVTYTPTPTPTGYTGATASGMSSSVQASSQAVVLTGLGIIATALLLL